MIRSTAHLICRPLLALIAVYVATQCSSSASCEETEGIVRTFAVMPANSAAPTECPDWLEDDSRRLVVTGPEQSNSIIFALRRDGDASGEDWQIRDAEGDVILDLQGTLWVQAPTLHVTSSGPDDTPDYLWLQEVKAGVTCATGPNGAVLSQHSFLISQINDPSDPEDGKWIVVTSGGSRRFCIGIAVFNR